MAHERLSHDIKLAEDKLDVYVKRQEEARIADALDRQKFANVSLIESPVRPYLPHQAERAAQPRARIPRRVLRQPRHRFRAGDEPHDARFGRRTGVGTRAAGALATIYAKGARTP